MYSSSLPGERQPIVPVACAPGTINLHGTFRYLLGIHSIKHQRANRNVSLVVFAKAKGPTHT